ncbi:MAG: nucleotidyltransferase family protein, partial [Phycisphaerales bacterium]|nr:nucleotidyltransferase family protein [Phycisphaerales bacterium]
HFVRHLPRRRGGGEKSVFLRGKRAVRHGLDQIQPVVLVGGKSSRFGRNKQIEQVNSHAMVSVAINALREVFGSASFQSSIARVLTRGYIMMGDDDPCRMRDGILDSMNVYY